MQRYIVQSRGAYREYAITGHIRVAQHTHTITDRQQVTNKIQKKDDPPAAAMLMLIVCDYNWRFEYKSVVNAFNKRNKWPSGAR